MNESSLRVKARIAGAFYLLVFVAGIYALIGSRGRPAAGLIAAACYVVVTLLFYDMFTPVNRKLSLLAAIVSLLGCANGILGPLGLAPFRINTLVLFGVYCLLIGYLIFKSDFLPRSLGALMALAGLGWLTFLAPPLAEILYPYNLAPGIIGEGALTLWLLAFGRRSVLVTGQ